eukprot:jgi/Mesvir1/1180/Mv17676-RA.1
MRLDAGPVVLLVWSSCLLSTLGGSVDESIASTFDARASPGGRKLAAIHHTGGDASHVHHGPGEAHNHHHHITLDPKLEALLHGGDLHMGAGKNLNLARHWKMQQEEEEHAQLEKQKAKQQEQLERQEEEEQLRKDREEIEYQIMRDREEEAMRREQEAERRHEELLEKQRLQVQQAIERAQARGLPLTVAEGTLEDVAPKIPCPNACSGHGLCKQGVCECVVAWRGAPDCSKPVLLPCNQRAVDFKGWVFTSTTIARDVRLYRSALCEGMQLKPDSPNCEAAAKDFPTLMKQQLDLPPVDPLLAMMGKSCALVGSSDALLSCGKGREIDAHDIVIRLNDAPTKGFEDHVGRRTDLRFQGMMRHLYREGDEYTINLSHALLMSGGGRNLITYPDIAGKAGYYTNARGTSNLQLSYGWKAIHAALHICSKVSIYGFTIEGPKSGAPRNGFGHYYQKWFNGKQFASWLMKQVVKESGSWKDMNNLRNWWLPKDRRLFSSLATHAANVDRFRAYLDALGLPLQPRMTAAVHDLEASQSLGKDDYEIRCGTPWTNHCLDEEAKCMAQLATFVKNVAVSCTGSGDGNGI